MHTRSSVTLGTTRSEPLVFLHGLFGGKTEGLPLCSLLAERYHTTLIDLPGHHLAPYENDILSSLRPALSHKPVIIGYSMGGRLALQLQENARAIICISAHPGLKTEEEKSRRAHERMLWQEKLLSMPLRDFFHTWYAQPLFSSLHEKPQLLEALIERRMSHSAHSLAAVMEQLCLSKQPRIERARCPLLFLHGTEDEKYKTLYDDIACTVQSIEKCGHMCHLENPLGCAQTILSWLEGSC
jgi:2-succinyl-6-hydroxy-2,4-cyclohexadiene-1-carboxylate synthase